MQATVELSPGQTQNREPFVRAIFGPYVTPEQQDFVLSLMHGYGLGTGWGIGPYGDAERAARSLARRLRKLGWSVSIA